MAAPLSSAQFVRNPKYNASGTKPKFYSKDLLESTKYYRNKTVEKAHEVISELLGSLQLDDVFKDKVEINVLVPAAGSFPSYVSFIDAMLQNFPRLRKINFTLLDINSRDAFEQMNLFVDMILDGENSRIKYAYPHFSSDVKLAFSGLEAFLQQIPEVSSLFNVVYFEHPQTSRNQILQDYCYQSKNIIPAVPFLITRLSEKALVISVHQTREEAGVMKDAIEFSLSCNAHTIQLPKGAYGALNLLFPYFFTSGNIAKVSRSSQSISEAFRRSDALEFSQKEYCVLLLISTFISGLINWSKQEEHFIESPSRITSSLLVLSQFIDHKPGTRGSLTKLGIVLAQLFLLLSALDLV